jgi:hypothetical protein
VNERDAKVSQSTLAGLLSRATLLTPGCAAPPCQVSSPPPAVRKLGDVLSHYLHLLDREAAVRALCSTNPVAKAVADALDANAAAPPLQMLEPLVARPHQVVPAIHTAGGRAAGGGGGAAALHAGGTGLSLGGPAPAGGYIHGHGMPDPSDGHPGGHPHPMSRASPHTRKPPQPRKRPAAHHGRGAARNVRAALDGAAAGGSGGEFGGNGFLGGWGDGGGASLGGGGHVTNFHDMLYDEVDPSQLQALMSHPEQLHTLGERLASKLPALGELPSAAAQGGSGGAGAPWSGGGGEDSLWIPTEEFLATFGDDPVADVRALRVCLCGA